MPATFWAFLFVVVCCVVALVLLTVVRRTHTVAHLESHHEVAGFLIGIVGVVYAVLLAFVVITAWERYSDAARNVAQEANQVGDLWQMSGGFRAEVREPGRQALITYAHAVVDTEWATMRRGEESDDAKRSFRQIWEFYRTIDPHGEREQALYGESLYTINLLSDARRTRLLDSEDRLPGVLWAALFVGGFITVAFTFLFQLKNFRLQVLMTVAVVAVIAITLFLVIALNHPFGSLLPVAPEAFLDQIARMRD